MIILDEGSALKLPQHLRPSLAGVDPSTAKDTRTIRIVKDASLTGGDPLFGGQQFNLGCGIAERAQDGVGRRAGRADFDRDGPFCA